MINADSKVIAQVFVGDNNCIHVLAATDAGYRRAKQIIKDDWCWPIYWEGRDFIETPSVLNRNDAGALTGVSSKDSPPVSTLPTEKKISGETTDF